MFRRSGGVDGCSSGGSGLSLDTQKVQMVVVHPKVAGAGKNEGLVGQGVDCIWEIGYSGG